MKTMLTAIGVGVLALLAVNLLFSGYQLPTHDIDAAIAQYE